MRKLIYKLMDGTVVNSYAETCGRSYVVVLTDIPEEPSRMSDKMREKRKKAILRK